MLKDLEISKLTESIESYLEGGAAELPGDVVASMFATECRDINKRLATIAGMIDSGGEMEALQVAEAHPRLIGRAELLCFGNEAFWQDYCSEHGFEVAPDIDMETIELLESIYARKISPNHRLYKDYRAAVHSRDEAKAFDLIRIITRLNPNDQNAQRELKRIKHKRVVKLLGKLEETQKDKNENALFRLLDELEQIAGKEAYENSPVYQDAIKWRVALRREHAIAAIPGQLESICKNLENGSDWHKAAQIHAEMTAQVGRYKIPLSPDQETVYNDTGAEIDALRKQAERETKIKQATKVLLRISEEVELAVLKPGGIDATFADASLREVAKHKRQLSELGANLNSTEQARLDAAADQMEQILERHRAIQKTRRITLAALLSMVLIALAVFGWFALQASDRVKLLVELQDSGQSKALENQINQLRDNKSLLLHFPSLSAQLAIADQWLTSVRATKGQTYSILDQMESAAGLAFTGQNAKAAHSSMVELEELNLKLPRDLQRQMDARMSILRNALDAFLLSQQEKKASEANELLKELAGWWENIENTDSALHIREPLEAHISRIKPFVLMSEEEVTQLRLPVSVETQVANMDQRLHDFLDKANAIIESLDRLGASSSKEEYEEIIIAMAGANFSEAQAAQKVLDTGFPSDAKIRAFVMFRGDMEAMKIAEKMPLDEVSMPQRVNDEDVRIIRKLLNAQSFRNVYKVECSKYGRKYTIYTNGKMEQNGAGNNAEWKFKQILAPDRRINDPDLKDTDVTLKAALGWQINQSKLSPSTELVDSLRLDNLVKDNGQFARSILALIDTVHSNNTAPTLAKAYILGQLIKLAEGRDRELQWGLQLVPEVRDAIQARQIEFDRFPLNAPDWLHAEKVEQGQIISEEAKWEAYFKETGKTRYYQNLRARQNLYRSGLKNQLKLAGVARGPGNAKLSKSYLPRVIVGLCLNDKKMADLRILGTLDNGEDEINLPDEILAFSPLYSLEFPSMEELNKILKIHRLEK